MLHRKRTAFPSHISASEAARISRTTNAGESFHSKFNESFYPNLFSFINVLENKYSNGNTHKNC